MRLRGGGMRFLMSKLGLCNNNSGCCDDFWFKAGIGLLNGVKQHGASISR